MGIKREYSTKIYKILKTRNIRPATFLRQINTAYPNTPMSKDHLSCIISGKRKSFTTTTLYKMCAILQLKPNDILDYEEEVK